MSRFKDYLLNKSDQYQHYKLESVRLKQENKELKDNLEKKTVYLETLLEQLHDNLGLDTKFCPICNSEIYAFLPFGEGPRKNALCPNCHSLERHRLSYLFLKEHSNIFNENIKMIHFAPEKIFSHIFSSQENIDYLPVDLNPNMDFVKEAMDIQNIKYPNNHFDFIYCSHVLEHVPDDQKAVNELYRVLKPEGTALIMVPINHSLNETFEDESVNTPELILKHYGQSDHVRCYGLDFQELLERNGFKCLKYSNKDFDKKSTDKYGLHINDEVFYCTK
jgi:predicted SAM-dependent methyltransferase